MAWSLRRLADPYRNWITDQYEPAEGYGFAVYDCTFFHIPIGYMPRPTVLKIVEKDHGPSEDRESLRE